MKNETNTTDNIEIEAQSPLDNPVTTEDVLIYVGVVTGIALIVILSLITYFCIRSRKRKTIVVNSSPEKSEAASNKLAEPSESDARETWKLPDPLDKNEQEEASHVNATADRLLTLENTNNAEGTQGTL